MELFDVIIYATFTFVVGNAIGIGVCFFIHQRRIEELETKLSNSNDDAMTIADAYEEMKARWEKAMELVPDEYKTIKTRVVDNEKQNK